MAELCGVYTSMVIARDMGWKKIIFKMDSQVALEMIKYGCNKTHPCKPILDSIRSLINLDWNVNLVHCLREGNRLADSMANLAHSSQVRKKGTMIYQQPPSGCRNIMSEDIKGISLPRMCAL